MTRMSSLSSQKMVVFQRASPEQARQLMDRIQGGDAGAAKELARAAGIKPLEALEAALSRDADGLFAIGGDRATRALLDASGSSRQATHGGLRQGGTVAHLSGFRDVQVPSRAASDGPAHRPELVSTSAPIDTTGMTRLAPDAARSLVDKLLSELGEQAAGVQKSHPSFQRRLSHAIKSRMEAARGGTPDPLLSEWSRLTMRPDSFDAYVDDKSGKTLLQERASPLPAAVAARIDEQRSLPLAEQLLRGSGDPSLTASVKQDLASSVPTDALELLNRSGVRMDVFADKAAINRLSPLLRERLGDAAAKLMWTDTSTTSGGRFDKLTGEALAVRGPGEGPHHVATIARHELMHALDFALGRDGQDLSSEPEFAALYEKTLAAKGKSGVPGFPTVYAGSSPQEFFAEAATIFLGRHVATGSGAEIVTTRDDLRRVNPETHAFFERLFAERVPAALKSGEGGQQRLAGWENHKREIESKPPAQRSKSEWFWLASFRTLGGCERLDANELRAAQAACQEVRKRERSLFGLRQQPNPQLDALEKSIERHLAKVPS